MLSRVGRIWPGPRCVMCGVGVRVLRYDMAQGVTTSQGCPVDPGQARTDVGLSRCGWVAEGKAGEPLRVWWRLDSLRGPSHGTSVPLPPELRDRAVHMVAEIRPNCPTGWAAMKAVAAKLGIGAAETVRTWVRKAEVDVGRRPGTTSEEAAQIKRLRAENAGLRRANEILEAARLALRPSSTGPRNARSVHRHSPRGVRSRADLPSPDQPRTVDRDEHLLRRHKPQPQRPAGP